MTPERLARLKESLDDPNLVSFEPWVVRELLDRIAQLEAQRGGAVSDEWEACESNDHEFLLCRKADPDNAVAAIFAVGENPSPYVDEIVNALNNKQRSVAVVAPGIMLSDISDECAAMPCNDREAFLRGALWSQRFISERIQPIPASQVLQPGMVGVDREELAALLSINDSITLHDEPPVWRADWSRVRTAKMRLHWKRQDDLRNPSHADRFASCPKNQVCTPHACEAGNGEWPRCPKVGDVAR